MEPESSPPYPKVPATRPYPESTLSSLHDPSNLLKIHLNIIPHLRLGLQNCRFPSGFPTNAMCTPLSSPIHATCPAHFIRLDFTPRTILFKVYRSFSSYLCSFHHSPVTSTLLGPNSLINNFFSNALSLRSSLSVSDQVSHPYKTTGKIIPLYILIFKCFDRILEDKRFFTE
jgi:hypothetical protein